MYKENKANNCSRTYIHVYGKLRKGLCEKLNRGWGGGGGGVDRKSGGKFCVFLPSKPQERREHIVNTFYDAVSPPPLFLPPRIPPLSTPA